MVTYVFFFPQRSLVLHRVLQGLGGGASGSKGWGGAYLSLCKLREGNTGERKRTFPFSHLRQSARIQTICVSFLLSLLGKGPDNQLWGALCKGHLAVVRAGD